MPMGINPETGRYEDLPDLDLPGQVIDQPIAPGLGTIAGTGDDISADEVAALMRAKGVPERIISQEAGSITRYGRSGVGAVIDQSLGQWMARGNGGTSGAPGAGATPRVTNWFSANAPSMSDYGAPPAPFSDTYTAGQYAAPEWNETFKAPTTADVESSPGYMADENAIRRGLERGAASKGSILSGGFAGAVVPRALAEHASTEYANTFQRAFDTYQQRYGAFSDSANRGAQAFGLNETGKFNQYQSRFNAYDANVKNTQTAERDRWQREIDLARLGLDSQIAGRPSA